MQFVRAGRVRERNPALSPCLAGPQVSRLSLRRKVEARLLYALTQRILGTARAISFHRESIAARKAVPYSVPGNSRELQGENARDARVLLKNGLT